MIQNKQDICCETLSKHRDILDGCENQLNVLSIVDMTGGQNLEERLDENSFEKMGGNLTD